MKRQDLLRGDGHRLRWGNRYRFRYRHYQRHERQCGRNDIPTVSITTCSSGAQNGAFDVTVVFSEAVTAVCSNLNSLSPALTRMLSPNDATVEPLTDTLGGTDAASFDIVSTIGHLQTSSGTRL